ncbi:MAG: thiamine pyrophosphate-dependent enzyme [Pseudomonadota bacterium]
MTRDVSISGGHLLLRCLLAQDARVAFGVPGESYLDVLDAMHEHRADFSFVGARHEGGAAFMAEAFAKLTGRPGICFVTRGPGASNAAIGIHAARQASTPLILFVGQIATVDRGREAFQEIDYRAYFGGVAKWVTEIDHVDRIAEIVARAFSVALSGRPGPVVVALPEDVLSARTTAAPAAATPIAEPAPARETVNAMAALLADAQRPLLLVGGGGWQRASRDPLRAFAERHRLPVVATFRCNDLFDNASPSYVGEAGVAMRGHVRELITDADLILAVGIRFGEMTTDAYRLLSPPQARQRLVHMHPDAGELGKIYQAALAAQVGVNAAAKALGELDLGQSWDDWCAGARARFEASLECPPQPGDLDMGRVCAWLREHLAGDAIITNGAGNFATWPGKYLTYVDERRLLAPQSGAMGYGLPAAVAAKSVYPERCVVCFAGDGDLQMNMAELGTAMQIDARPIVLVVNNQMYGTIRMHQEKHYPARVSGTDIVNPDFVAIAGAYGMHAERIERTDDFAAAFARAVSSPTGALLELMVDPEALTPEQTVSGLRDAAGGDAS